MSRSHSRHDSHPPPSPCNPTSPTHPACNATPLHSLDLWLVRLKAASARGGKDGDSGERARLSQNREAGGGEREMMMEASFDTEESFDDPSCLAPQPPGSVSPAKRQIKEVKETKITVSIRLFFFFFCPPLLSSMSMSVLVCQKISSRLFPSVDIVFKRSSHCWRNILDPQYRFSGDKSTLTRRRLICSAERAGW